MKTSHMFRTIAIVSSLLPSLAVAEYDMAFVNEKVAPLAAKISAIPKHLLMVDDTTDLLKTPEFQALRAKCTTDWAQIAANIDKVQGGDEARKLVIYAFENLSPQNYMTVVEQLVSQYESGKMSEESAKALLGPTGRMQDFIVDNYAHPRVIAVLNRIKTKTKDPALHQRIVTTLNGSAKELLDTYRDDHQGMPEAGGPPVILPP